MPKVSNREAGDRFFSALIKSVSIWVAALVDEIPIIMVLSVNNSTVSVIRSDLVLEMYYL